MAYSSEFEPIGGNLLQTIALYYGVYKPINGSYIQAMCEAVGYYEPMNGSWVRTLLENIYNNSEIAYDGEGNLLPITMINDDYWQTILYYIGINEQYFLDNYGLDVSFPINGSWVNTYYQFTRNEAGGYIAENGSVLLVSEPTWSGSNTYVFGRPTTVILNDYLITNGLGLGCEGRITFDSNTTYISSFGNYIKNGSGYKVGDTITLPSLVIPEITGDIVFTVLEVLEY